MSGYTYRQVAAIAATYQRTREPVKAIRYDRDPTPEALRPASERWADEDRIIAKCDLELAMAALLDFEMGRGLGCRRHECVRLGVMAGYSDEDVAGKLQIAPRLVAPLRRQGLEFLYWWLKGDYERACAVAPESPARRVSPRELVTVRGSRVESGGCAA